MVYNSIGIHLWEESGRRYPAVSPPRDYRSLYYIQRLYEKILFFIYF